MMSSELKKCPICGKTDTLRIMEGDRVWIECMDGEDACGLSTGFFDTITEAIAAWNRRAEPDVPWSKWGRPKKIERTLVREEIDDEEIDGLSQNHLDHNILPPTAMPNDNCCGKCNGSGKPSAEALLVAIGLLEGFYPIYEKVEGSDPLPEVIDWLRKVANHEV